MGKSMGKDVHLRMKREGRMAWNFLLQKGFFLAGRSGMTVCEFLVESVGYDRSVIDEQVRTIFLNSRPVDDIDNAHLHEGARLALGSAMPGLVGICMGRDNPYKSFRSGIAAGEDSSRPDEREVIRVFVKVFSTLAVDTGDGILGRGIMLDAGVLREFLERNAANLIAGQGVSVQAFLADFEEVSGDVMVRVEFV
jgi:hypothetical protein